MNNLYSFIREYGNQSFEEKPVTTIDIMIFSQIPYINFENCFKTNNEEIKLSDLWEKAKIKNLKPTFFGQKTAIKLIDTISTKKRYKDLILKNYVYYLKEDTQFGAITLVVPNDSIYVIFEGTDSTVWGWKEDFQLTYIYPTNSQIMAKEYLNNTIKLNGPKVVVCGHSKGGNLALVASMKTDLLKKIKIRKIYSFDGPGLKNKEFKSLNYKLIKNRLINIIPNSSIVGILLNQENVNIIKSRGIGFFQHDLTTWIVDDDKLRPSEQDKISKRLDESIANWLSKHNYKEREEIIEGIFNIFEETGMTNFFDSKVNKLELVSKLIKSANNMSEETKEVIITSIKLLFTDIGTDIINDTKKDLKELHNNIEKYFNK